MSQKRIEANDFKAHHRQTDTHSHGRVAHPSH